MKSYAIIGLSSFGHFLAKKLSESGHQILVIDRSENRIERVKSFVDKAVIADATDKEMLVSLGLADMDGVVVSLGDSMDASVLVTLYLRELKVSNIIAKALTEDHGKILNIIGANRVVFPERDEAYRLAKTLESEYILDAIKLSDDISIIEIAPPQAFVGHTLGELDLRKKYGVLVLVIKEIVPEEIVLVPDPQHMIKDTSVLMILGKEANLAKIKKMK
ncbi:TrkA family potassium uptake protein [candidate division KSB1 bacterium]|nr:TrkA family potassium uptake protein [candidate division KSB1 bacterium]RQW00618.1 MAG: TrkA family potassium uptake protein [candidate division KSB1 bacterium]